MSEIQVTIVKNHRKISCSCDELPKILARFGDNFEITHRGKKINRFADLTAARIKNGDNVYVTSKYTHQESPMTAIGRLSGIRRYLNMGTTCCFAIIFAHPPTYG